MRKLALETSRAAVAIIIPAGKTVPLVVPIARVRHRLELGLSVGKRRLSVF